MHTRGREPKDTPGDLLVAAFEDLIKLPRFHKNNGTDFVFYDSHPGFTAGKASRPYWIYKCFVRLFLLSSAWASL